MNRGRSREDIFLAPDDYEAFLEVLREFADVWNLKVASYCLMPYHYQLLVQTPDGNISRCMRHAIGVYTQRFNRKHGRDGQLFRGRYKAVQVEADSYLPEPVARRAAYHDFVTHGEPDEIANFYSLSNMPSIQGDSSFKEWLGDRNATLPRNPGLMSLQGYIHEYHAQVESYIREGCIKA